MKLNDLKQGDVFYDVTINGITKYEYLMLYPFHNPKNVKVESYHIILDKDFEEPKRMYYTMIEKILEKKCFNYEDAKKYKIKLLEEYLEYLKSKQ